MASQLDGGIAWCDETWNPWHGCIKVSAGCKNCYMYTGKRMYGQDPRLVVRSKTKFKDPLKWKDPQRVFTCSWSDFFIEEADAWRGDAWEIIRDTPHLTYQILTKRPERFAGHLPPGWPLPNVWLGVSAENQEALDERVPHLLATPASVRFVSAEPLLGPLTFFEADPENPHALRGPAVVRRGGQCGYIPGEPDEYWEETEPGIDWVIVGGESGPSARPCDVAWIRAIVEQCKAAGVACFVKQLGAHVIDRNDAGFDGDDGCDWPMDTETGESDDYQGAPLKIRLVDRKGGDPAEWPEDLRVREFPHV